MKNYNYHQPVLLEECIRSLHINEGIYVDATFGGGGHSRRMLQESSKATIIAFDQDPDAIKNGDALKNEFPDRFILIEDNFANLMTRISLLKITGIDGILFDLGSSSYQFDEASKGFSFQADGELDMRMSPEIEISAFDVINDFSQDELAKIFFEYGEEKKSYKIAHEIINARKNKNINTTLELASIVEKCVGGKFAVKSKARIFQALRIFINDEINVLEKALDDAVKLLRPDGIISVISYHSLEDRTVKNFFKNATLDCICPVEFPQCQCDKVSSLEILTKKPIIPTDEEIENNPRARSAKLRIAKRKEILCN